MEPVYVYGAHDVEAATLALWPFMYPTDTY